MSNLKLTLSCLAVLAFLISCNPSRNSTNTGGDEIIVGKSAGSPTTKPVAKEHNAIQIKYAGILQTKPEQIANLKLYQFIDNWMGTPYKWGGTDKRGIDCSAFIQKLLDTAYNITIPRTSIEQFFVLYIDRFASKKHLYEGDLVFFTTIGENVVSHVGMYLHNNMFINASSKGVSIGKLDDPYWEKRYVAAGRVKVNLLSNYKK